MRLILWMLLCGLTITGQSQSLVRQERNITAFARLYGYVRYFHPSDEAQKIDWFLFVGYGARSILHAPDDQALVYGLKKLFGPIAPSVGIFTGRQQARFDVSGIRPADTTGYSVVSWQYMGLATDYTLAKYPNSAYHSIRLNRHSAEQDKEKLDSFSYGQLYQTIPVSNKRARFKLTATMKVVAEDDASGQLWLSCQSDTPVAKGGSHFDMSDRPVRDKIWKEYTLQGTLDSTVKNIYLGLYLKGRGTLSVRGLKCSIEQNGRMTDLLVRNKSFEQREPDGKLIGWQTLPYNNYSYRSIPVRGQQGTTLEISSLSEEQFLRQPAHALFPQHVGIGEYAKKELVPGITAIIPLALYGRSEQTFPKGDTGKLNRLISDMGVPSEKTLSIDSVTTKLGSLIIAWNIYRHFFPYWNMVSASPDSLWNLALKKTFTDHDAYDFLQTLKLMCAAMNDGHMFANLLRDTTISHSAPLSFALADNAIVIEKVLDPVLTAGLLPGDRIDSIDGLSADEALRLKERLVSGSPQFKQYTGLQMLTLGPTYTPLRLVVRRDGAVRTISVDHSFPPTLFRSISVIYPRTGVREWKPGFFYCDLTQKEDVITPNMDRLLHAKAIVFDYRGYPGIDYTFLIRQLLEHPDTSKWLQTPMICYPDLERVAFSGSGWELSPLAPHFSARIYFLTDARVISAAESFISYIKDYRLGTIVGGTTAGANGDINYFYVPGVYQLSFSGLRVTRHNGTRFFMLGCSPDVPISPTIKGIKEGRDEIQEAAEQLAEKQSSTENETRR